LDIQLPYPGGIKPALIIFVSYTGAFLLLKLWHNNLMYIPQPVQPTIAAIASGAPPSAVAIIRVSGPKAWPIASQLFRRRNGKQPELKPGKLYTGWFVDPTLATESTWNPDKLPAALLDEGVLLVFKGPNSFTGDDVVEFQCHGGEFITRLLLDWCFRLGAQPAEPGEFTKQAMVNGKMDLTQAESIMDLIHSQGAAMARSAAQNLHSRTVGLQVQHMIDTLMEVQAEIVACVDFPDEVEEPDRASLINKLTPLSHQADGLIMASEHNRMIRDGLKVALLGLPNSGKSSLFNALLAADRAIVSEVAGTTRDVLTEQLMIDGLNVTLIDTAGIRETENQIEILGIARSWQAATDATGILYLFDASVGLLREDRRLLAALQAKLPDTPILLVANKLDAANTPLAYPDDVYRLSAKTGEGIAALGQWLKMLVAARGPQLKQQEQGIICLNARQLDCLKQLKIQLGIATEALSARETPIDLASFPLSQALRASEQLLGLDTTEGVLDNVFTTFCVGK
jgi:tRNA modification GTPase